MAKLTNCWQTDTVGWELFQTSNFTPNSNVIYGAELVVFPNNPATPPSIHPFIDQDKYEELESNYKQGTKFIELNSEDHIE